MVYVLRVIVEVNVVNDVMSVNDMHLGNFFVVCYLLGADE